jgi:glycosyltransferase involved in cell wall biosynthesis
MIVTLIATVYNEATMLPYFLQHYAGIVDRFVFFDGMSTDGTREMIEGMPDAVLHDLDTGGKIDDGANIAIKNIAYRAYPDSDWFVVVDADEFLYHTDLRGLLETYDRVGVTIAQCEGWDMIGDGLEGIAPGAKLTDWIQHGVRNAVHMDKCALFKPCVSPNYVPGAHACSPSGVVVLARYDVRLLHYKYLGLDWVRRKAAACQLSEANHRNLWGYMAPGVLNKDTWVDYYLEAREKRIRVL